MDWRARRSRSLGGDRPGRHHAGGWAERRGAVRRPGHGLPRGAPCLLPDQRDRPGAGDHRRRDPRASHRLGAAPTGHRGLDSRRHGRRLGSAAAAGGLVGHRGRGPAGDLRGADRGGPSRRPADQAADAAAHLHQRAGGHPPGQELQRAARRQRRQRPGRAGRDRRPPRSQWGGKDHDLLPYNGSDPSGRGPGQARRARLDSVADVRARPRRDRLPGPGALDLPENDGSWKPGISAGTSGTGSSTACWTSCPSSTCAGTGPTA